MNNKLEKKIFKVHMKTVVKISYYMLKGDINTENIKIAQGKYKMPETFSEGFKQIKQKIQWHKK